MFVHSGQQASYANGSQDRASLACTIPWFNSTQAGMYYKDEFCWGLLINEDCGARAYVDDEVVITRL